MTPSKNLIALCGSLVLLLGCETTNPNTQPRTARTAASDCTFTGSNIPRKDCRDSGMVSTSTMSTSDVQDELRTPSAGPGGQITQ